MTASEEYPIHVILGDRTYCKIRTDPTFKGHPEDPIVEGTTFGWVIHGGAEYTNKLVYVRQRGERLREALQLRRVGGRGQRRG